MKSTSHQQDINELWAYVYNLKKELKAQELLMDNHAVEIVKLQNLLMEISVPIDRLKRTIELYLNKQND